jgi:solute carrier family 25 (mitochondrial phosphate transporter), member 23/24/25/41
MAEFKVFVQNTEKELWQLFDRIDRDNNGKLDKDELKEAFRRAGLAVSKARLEQFFDEVDVNDDGVITYEEWRCVASSGHLPLRELI